MNTFLLLEVQSEAPDYREAYLLEDLGDRMLCRAYKRRGEWIRSQIHFKKGDFTNKCKVLAPNEVKSIMSCGSGATADVPV